MGGPPPIEEVVIQQQLIPVMWAHAVLFSVPFLLPFLWPTNGPQKWMAPFTDMFTRT